MSSNRVCRRTNFPRPPDPLHVSTCLAAQKLTLILTDAAKVHLAREGYHPVYGARPLKHVIQRDLLDPLSMEILAGRFLEGQTITADAREGKMVFNS